jgi:hypothetical protein
MKLHHAYLLLACFAASPALALVLASASVPGNLSGSRTDTRPVPDKHVATGPRTDDTRNCDSRGTHSDKSSSSVGVGPDGSSAKANGGPSGLRTDFFGCEATIDANSASTGRNEH